MRVTLNFVKAIDCLAENINTPEVNSYVLKLSNAMLERLNKADQKDLKEIDTINVGRFLSFMNKIFKRCESVDGNLIKIDIEASIIINSIKSDDFVNKSNILDTIKNRYSLTTIRKAYD